MSRLLPILLVLSLTAALPAWAAEPATSLRGSPSSMVRQNRVARTQDYSFLRTEAEVQRMARSGYLVRLEGNEHYRLANVGYPYARPVVATFIERLGRQYHAACDERLVVTSLTRPLSEQPGNAHQLSVHPAGMAVDLRVSSRKACREWLEETLLTLEEKGLLDATREQRPPHYHVAVFPEAYQAHVAALADAVPADPPAPAVEPTPELSEPTPVMAALAEPELPVTASLAVDLPGDDDDRDAWTALAAVMVTILGLVLRLTPPARARATA